MSDLPGSNVQSRGAEPYLLYCFDRDGRRQPGEPLDAEDDLMAIALVRLELHNNCELWQGDRLVFVTPNLRARA